MFDRIITVTVKTSGEVIEYRVMNSTDLTSAYADVEAHIEAYRQIKSSLMNTSMEMLKQQDKEKPDVKK